MVSLGPGDYELITLKGIRALQKSEAVCIPTKSRDGSFKRSIAYKIVKDILDDFGFEKKLVPVFVPMKFNPKDWENQADTVYRALNRYKKVSFVTLGDAGIYSTIYYMLDIIKKRDYSVWENCEVIAGVTSFSLSSAKIKKPLCLGDSRLEIIPFSNQNAKKTKVYMRPFKDMKTDFLKESGEFYTFEKLDQGEERISKGKPKMIKNYMTLIIDFIKNETT